MSDLPRAIVIAALILGGAFVVRGMFGTDRYDLMQATVGSVYRLDQLTGAVAFCTPLVCRPLVMLVPKAATPGGSEPPPAVPAPEVQPGPAT